MKNLLTAALLAGFSTGAMAQGPEDVVASLGNVSGALTTLISGGQSSTVALLDGEVTNFFNTQNDANIAAINLLTEGTPAAPLGALFEQVNTTGYDALVPLYLALDGPAMQLADAGAPVLDPLQSAIGSFELPAGGLGSSGSAGGLSLASLPLSADALNADALTQLLSGASLPGLQ